jgi:hypothetical protein
MGKRELLILVVLLTVGAVVYRLTAPPADDGEREGFSLGRLVDEIRTEIAEDSSSAALTHEGTIDLSPAVKRVRIGRFTGQIVVTGEDRTDIGYEVEVRSTGPDEDTARGYARRTVLVEDDFGDTLDLRIHYPVEAQQRTALVLRVPAGLAVTIESGSSRSFIINDIASVHLAGVIGEFTAESIAGAVTGDHRSGRLTVTGAGTVNLSLLNSRAAFSRIESELVLNARGGEVSIGESQAAIVLQQTNVEMTIANHEGTIRIEGSGGEIALTDPRAEVNVEVRSTRIEIVFAHAVPMRVITTTDPLRLVLDGAPAFVLNAALSGGRINATDVGLEATALDQRVVLHHAFGDASAPRVTLRNRGDDIVIRTRK